MNKKLLLCLFVVVLSGCTNQSEKAEIETLKQANEDLTKEVNNLKRAFDGYDYTNEVSFKDVITINAKVLEIIEGDPLYHHYLIVTQDDVDHNTPLLIGLEDSSLKDKFVIGKSYDLSIHTQLVVDKESNIARFMYVLMQ